MNRHIPTSIGTFLLASVSLFFVTLVITQFSSFNFLISNLQSPISNYQSLISPHSQTASILDSDSALVGHYTFDDASNLGADSSGKGNNGSAIGTPTGATGKIGSGSINVAGGGGLSLGDLSAVENQTALTISVWVKNNQTGNVSVSDSMVKKEGTGADTFQMYWSQSEDVAFCVVGTGGTSCGGTNSAYSQFAKGIPDGAGNRWHHVVGVYDGVAGTVKTYVDGVAGASVGSMTLPTQNSVHPVVIGGTWDGLIDDVRIYTRALSDAEVQQLYSEGGGSTGDTTSTNTGTTNTGDTTSNTNTNTAGTPSGDTTSSTPVNGSCGPAAKTYTSTESFPQGSYCSSGSASPTSPTNPISSASSAWSCSGTNGGSSASCTATRQPEQVVQVRTPAPAPISWTPPIGIPEPSFGIRETHFMYQLGLNETCQTAPNKCYDFGSGLEPYRDAGAGPYTHYIDNTSPSSTDTNNPFGTPTKPRKTVPISLSAGSVVEVHGGTYGYKNFGGTKIAINGNGTKERPIFVRGPSINERPAFSTIILARGKYMIVENLKTNGSFNFRSDASDPEDYNHHMAFRHSESDRGVYATSYVSNKYVNNIVIFDNHIHANIGVTYLDGTTGIFDPTSTKEFKEADRIGVPLGAWTEYVWVLDNDIHNTTGDAVGTGHAAGYTVKKYFIGRNKLHDTGENGVDLKEVQDFVVSQNEMYGFNGGSSGSDGTAVVIHYGPQLSPINAWFLFNIIHDSRDSGIQVGGDQAHESYFIGNVVYNISNENMTGKGFITWNSKKINLIGNIFYNNDNGLNLSGDPVTAGPLIFKNNIVSTIRKPGGYFFAMSGSNYKKTADISNNIFYQPGGSVNMFSNMSLDQFKTSVNPCTNCTEADPQFTNPAVLDFSLKSTSPAINTADAAIMEDLASRFYASFGVDIRKDFLGNTRPAGGNYDIGAYEYGATGGNNGLPPATPICTSFNYSSWGTCTNGSQSRTITSSNPTYCTGGNPILTQACTVATLIGDFNHDGAVNSVDFSALSAYWNQSSSVYDITGDNLVNTLDYVVLVKNWSK